MNKNPFFLKDPDDPRFRPKSHVDTWRPFALIISAMAVVAMHMMGWV